MLALQCNSMCIGDHFFLSGHIVWLGLFQMSLVVMYILSTFCVSFCRLKNFNLLFDELYQRQTQWTIPDNELREAVRLAVGEVLLPAYRSFVKRYRYVYVYFFQSMLLDFIDWFSTTCSSPNGP
jgi:hypothetical protein